MNQPAKFEDVRRERRGLTARDFELLVDAGAFVDCGKTELIDGDVYVMNAQWARHGRIKGNLFLEFATRLRALGSELRALVEVSAMVAGDSMPEPDVMITRWHGDRAVPGDSILLVAEVSESTLDVDLGRKRQLYALARIPEYWVVDVAGSRILVHTQPDGDAYAVQREVRFGEPLAATTLDGIEVDTSRLSD